MNVQVLALALVCFTAGCYGADRTVTVSATEVMAAEVGGAITLTRTDNTTRTVTVSIAAIKEIAGDGSEIGTIGTADHSVTDFSTATFTFTPTAEDTYPGTSIKVDKFSATTDIVIDNANNVKAMLTMEVVVFKQTDRPRVNIDGTAMQIINPGDVRVSLKIANWPFCGAGGLVCEKNGANVTGMYLDVVTKVKGATAAAAKAGFTNVYTVGWRSTYTASNKVMYDGSSTTQNMPANYPAHSTSGTDDLFTFRLAKFNTDGKIIFICSLGRNNTFFDNIKVETVGRSGKTSIKDIQNPSKKITIEFDSVIEVDADGNKITEQGHSFNNFASQDFTINPLGKEATYQGLEVRYTKFEANLKNTAAKMTCHINLFVGDGNVTNYAETYDMRAGAMKFDIEIQNWAFCGTGATTCKRGVVGEYLDFNILIKGKGDQATPKNDTGANKGMQYDLGYGTLTLTDQVQINGQLASLASGYPKLDSNGLKKTFQFRFPKFTNMYYDPGVAVNDDSESGGGGGGDSSNAGNDVIASHLPMIIFLFCCLCQLML